MKKQTTKKRIVFRKWLNTLISGLAIISFTFIVITIDNLGNPNYDKLLLLNIIVFVGTSLLICEYGRPIED